MNTTHGGRRDNAGRKALADDAKKKTIVIRVSADLLPAIERLKQGDLINVTENQNLIDVTNNQDEINRLLEVNSLRVSERDSARLERDQLKSQVTRLESLRAENKALSAQLQKEKDKHHACQCLTKSGDKCDRIATHENKLHGFVVRTCEQHYQTAINKSGNTKPD